MGVDGEEHTPEEEDEQISEGKKTEIIRDGTVEKNAAAQTTAESEVKHLYNVEQEFILHGSHQVLLEKQTENHQSLQVRVRH